MDVTAIRDRMEAIFGHRPYNPCFLLVHHNVAQLHRLATALSDATGWPMLSVGEQLSATLLDVPSPQRPAIAVRALYDLIDSLAPGPLLCTEVDLLFEPALNLDPLALFRHASQRVPLLVFWPGEYANTTLTYAVADHAHYHRWPGPDICNGCILTL